MVTCYGLVNCEQHQMLDLNPQFELELKYKQKFN